MGPVASGGTVVVEVVVVVVVVVDGADQCVASPR
jgi:hypothetical protein